MFEYYGLLYNIETTQAELFYNTLNNIIDEEQNVLYQKSDNLNKCTNNYYYEICGEILNTNMDDMFYKNIIQMIEVLPDDDKINVINIKLEDRHLNIKTEIICKKNKIVEIQKYIYTDEEIRISRGEWGNLPPTSVIEIPKVMLNNYFDNMIINQMLGENLLD